MLDKARIERLQKAITLLDMVINRAMAAGEGPNISDDLFKRIDDLHIELLKELGHEVDPDKVE